MQVHLKVLKGPKAGREIKLPIPQCLVGRSKECHLRSQLDAISHRHCVITTTENAVVVRDLQSLNGTYVNGEKVTEEAVLHGGDQLRIGPLVFEVVIKLAKAPQPAIQVPQDVVPGTAGGNANLSTLIVESSQRLRTPATTSNLESDSRSEDSTLAGAREQPELKSGHAVVVSGGFLRGATGTVVKRVASGDYLVALGGQDGQVWVKIPAHLLRAA